MVEVRPGNLDPLPVCPTSPSEGEVRQQREDFIGWRLLGKHKVYPFKIGRTIGLGLEERTVTIGTRMGRSHGRVGTGPSGTPDGPHKSP